MKSKMNKELIYAIIFFVAAIMFFYFNPLDQIRNFIELSPNEWTIKQKIFDLGIFPVLYNVANISLAGSVTFLLFSAYLGIKSMKKASI